MGVVAGLLAAVVGDIAAAAAVGVVGLSILASAADSA